MVSQGTFPVSSRPSGSPIKRVQHVENALHRHFDAQRRFLPFLSLHEFEAWLFSSIDELPRVLVQSEKQADFAAIRNQFETPEDINERPRLSPSNRIVGLFTGYKKPLRGPTAALRIGLERIRAECAHFTWWVTQLEDFAKRD